MIFLSAEIQITDGEIIRIDNSNSKSIKTLTTDRADYNMPSWGILSTTSAISAVDKNGDFKRFVEEGKLTNGKVCEIYLENSLIGAKQRLATKYVSDWKYNGITKNLSVEAQDDLEEWQTISFDGVNYVPTVSVDTSFETIFYDLYRATPEKYNMRPFSELDTKTQEILRKTFVRYYTMKADNLWASWNKLCQCCGLYIYKNHNGETIVSADFSIYELPFDETPDIPEEEKITLEAPIIRLITGGGNEETEEQLTAPLLSLDGHILTITDESGLAERFDIIVDGEVKETIEVDNGGGDMPEEPELVTLPAGKYLLNADITNAVECVYTNDPINSKIFTTFYDGNSAFSDYALSISFGDSPYSVVITSSQGFYVTSYRLGVWYFDDVGTPRSGEIAEEYLEACRTIEILEDIQVTQEFYDTFTANTTNVTDLTGTTWNVPSGWTATAGYGSFDLEYDMNGLHSGDPFLIGYSIQVEDFTAVPYADAIVYASGASITNSQSFTIHITDGVDVRNPLLISWITTYGRAVPNPAP